jgi:hypothetical protein
MDAPTHAGDIFTEQAALAELRLWAKNRPNWQQEALRRLLLNDELTENDIDSLVKICNDATASFVPITDAEIALEAASTRRLLFCASRIRPASMLWLQRRRFNFPRPE